MIKINNKEEINLIRHAGKINYLTHQEIKKNIKVGITTKFLDEIAYNFIISNDCTPSFLNYNGFPGSICTSVNDVVVHGIPGDYKLKNGDIISIDIGVCYKGYHSDSAYTHILGNVSKEVKTLVTETENSLYEAMKVVKNGVPVNEIGKTVENHANKHGLGVVLELVGHGVGEKLHMDPDIPNYDTDIKDVLKTGMVIAIEPMLNLGTEEIHLDKDEWTIKTNDKKPSAHFEHTILITEDGYEMLTGE